MEVELFTESGVSWTNIFFKCPVCKHCGDEEDGLQYQDYVDYPMLWCEWCDGNDRGGRYVMDPTSFKTAMAEFDRIAESHTGPDVQRDRTRPLTETDMHSTSFKIPLLFIERLSDHYMSDFRSARPLSPEEIKELTESYSYKKFNNSYDPEVVKKLGLTSADDSNCNEDCFNNEDPSVPPCPGCPPIMNISVPVNSYDAFTPSIPFVGNVSKSHDGVYIFLQVKDLDGGTSIIRFWGC